MLCADAHSVRVPRQQSDRPGDRADCAGMLRGVATAVDGVLHAAEAQTDMVGRHTCAHAHIHTYTPCVTNTAQNRDSLITSLW